MPDTEVIEEWMMTPVYDKDFVPKGMVYTCPKCGMVSDHEYPNCPNPFCKVRLDPD